jgi:hypothetical protein
MTNDHRSSAIVFEKVGLLLPMSIEKIGTHRKAVGDVTAP